MQKVTYFLAAIFWTLAGAHGGLAQAEKRAALVIGNSDYQHTRALPNSKNDAEAIAKLLSSNGFSDVTLKRDLDFRAMRGAVRAFAEAAREVDVAVVYYAGHGIEIAGENYLVPIDAKLLRDDDLEYEAMTLGLVLKAVSNARRLRLVVLDACRNNPLGERMTLGTGVTRSVTRGLARIEPKGDVLVAYSARAGTVAHDGRGQHSPYAEALLKHMPTPGLDVRLMFGKVRDHVLAATRQEQEPWTYGSLSGDVVALVPGTPLTTAQELELKIWNSVKDSTTPAVLGTYLEHYPNGEFASIARALIEHYERQHRADLAAREEARKRQEEERVVAAVKRIEEERRAREAVLAEERKRAEEAKNSAAAKLVEEKQRADWLARTEELRKLSEDMQKAREALAAAEKQRLANEKAAQEAATAAQQAIAAKREAEKAGSPAKLAALPKIEPKIEKPQGPSQADGTLWVKWRHSEGCGGRRESGTYPVFAAAGKLAGHNGRLSGTISDAGEARWAFPSSVDGVTFNCTVVVRGGKGFGSCTRAMGHCIMSIAVNR